MIPYLLYRTAAILSRIVPNRVARAMAAGVALLFFAARPGIRRNVAHNFRRLGLPGRSTWPVFRNFSRAVTDFLRLDPRRRDRLLARCTLSGTDNLDRALRAGKGAILFAPHLGPWELAAAYLTSLGHRIHTVALEHPSARVTRFFSAKRGAWGIVDYPSRTCAVGLRRALGRGELVVLLVDRNFSPRGLRLHFLGEEVLLPGGHVVLARRSGAPLLPCCCHYESEDRIVGTIGEPIFASPSGASAAESGSACLRRIEEFVRAHPDQWFAFDHLWRGKTGA